MTVLQRRWRLVLAATLLHAVVAGFAVSPLFFMPSVATARRVFGGSNGERALFEDVRAYHDYASRTLNGVIPYRDFDVEYPIGALPLFLVPRLIASEEIAYRWAFAAEMLLFDAALVWLVAKRGERTIGAGRAVFWYSLGLGCLGGLPIARFDLAAAFLTFAAMMAWESNRAGIAGFLAGIGGLVKLFPIVVVAPWMVQNRDRRMRLSVILMSTVFIGAGLWWIIGGAGVAKSLHYHSGRGLEIESLYAGILIVVAKMLGWPLAHHFNHSSVELIAPYAGIAAKISPLFQLAAMGWILFRSLRAESTRSSQVARVVPDQCSSGSLDQHGSSTIRASQTRTLSGQQEAACVLAFALFSKVLSPQYLLWLLPFAATLEGRAGARSRPLLVAACGLTTLLYFWAGVGLVQFHPLAIAILNGRNVLLLGIFLVLFKQT